MALACVPARAFEFGCPEHMGCPAEVITGMFAAWGDVECIEGEVLECSFLISLKDMEGVSHDFPLAPTTSFFINGYPGLPAAMQPVSDAPFYARCYTSGGRLLLVDASFVGFECLLLGYRAGAIHVRLADGAEMDLELWPQEDPEVRGILKTHVVPGVFVLVDSDSRVRRIWRSDMNG